MQNKKELSKKNLVEVAAARTSSRSFEPPKGLVMARTKTVAAMTTKAKSIVTEILATMMAIETLMWPR